jgi:aminobenzoyl-glutamate utilization protein B
VIPDGGDQPNVVPQTASIWFYFRHLDYDRTLPMFEAARRMAEGAALMTDTQVDTVMIIGSAMDQHFSKSIAETMGKNIMRVGMPRWDNNDITLAKALQKELGVRETGLDTTANGVRAPNPNAVRTGGGSDDIGDVSWVVPTAILSYPSNVPGMTGHHWSSAMAMATPIAHQGATAGAKVIATTVLDLLRDAALRADAESYFRDEQLRGTAYEPFIGPDDAPPIEKNREIMAEFKDRLRPLYYDPTRYETYLEQLGVRYPQLERPEDR